MKVASSPILVWAALLFATTLPALADTVTLKSGEILDGKIVGETDKEIVMDVMVSSGVTDQKTLAKDTVRTSAKTPLDELAFQSIKGCQVESHSLPLANYAGIIKTLEAFLKQYPKSAHAAEVQTRLDAFKKDQEHVKNGELKWNNRWYTRQEAEKNKYQLGAQVRLETMREQVARRDYMGALNTFELLEKSQSGSRAYPDAVELALKIMRTVAGDIDRMMASAKAQETQFNAGVQLASEPQKTQMLETRKAQVAAAEAALSTAEHSGAKWKPLLPLAIKSFEVAKSTLASETPRLEKISVETLRSSIVASDEAETALQVQKPDVAEEKIKEAQTLWAQNERIVALNADLVALKEELKPKPTPKPTPTPKPKKASAATQNADS